MSGRERISELETEPSRYQSTELAAAFKVMDDLKAENERLRTVIKRYQAGLREIESKIDRIIRDPALDHQPQLQEKS